MAFEDNKNLYLTFISSPPPFTFFLSFREQQQPFSLISDRKGFQSIFTQKCRIPTKSHSSFITGVCVPNEQIFNANPIIQDPFKKFVPLLSAHRAELSSSYSGKCAIFDCQIAKRHFANKYDKCIYYEQLILCETDTVVHQQYQCTAARLYNDTLKLKFMKQPSNFQQNFRAPGQRSNNMFKTLTRKQCQIELTFYRVRVSSSFKLSSSSMY